MGGYPHHGLTSLLVFSLLPLSGWIGKLIPVFCCRSLLLFTSLLDECSMMTFKIAIHLTTGQGQFRRHPLHYWLGSLPGSSLRIPGKFVSSRFLASPIMTPTIKISPSLLSVFVFPPFDHLFLQVLHSPPLIPSPSFCPSFHPTPMV